MMSDIEEPPTKVTKIELAVAEASDDPIEGIEHSQEEWLSEGVLTDDDYNQTMEQDGTFSNIGNTSQDESTMQSTNFDSLENTDNPEIDPQEYGVQGELKAESLQMDSQDATGNLHIDYQESVGNVQIEFQDNGQNVKVEYKARENAKIGTHGNAEITETEEQAMLNTVEETLNNFENERTLETMVQVDNSETLTEDLSMYLIKKNEVKKEEQKYSEDKQDVEKDDGNDTDELLGIKRSHVAEVLKVGERVGGCSGRESSSAVALRQAVRSKKRHQHTNLYSRLDAERQTRATSLHRMKEGPVIPAPQVPCRPQSGLACARCAPLSRGSWQDLKGPSDNGAVRNILEIGRQNFVNKGVVSRYLCDLAQCVHLTKYDYKDVVPDVVKDDTYQKAIEDSCQQELRKMPQHDGKADTSSQCQKIRQRVEATAVEVLIDISSAMSKNVLRFVAWLCQKAIRRVADGSCGTRAAGIEQLCRAKTAGLPLVFVPLHRSHFDYILVTFTLYMAGLRPPLVAAGDNMRIPFFGWFLRGCGAFYVKRCIDGSSDHGDPVYKSALKAYILNSLEAKNNLQFFIEGERSRTGKSQPPKDAGILSVIMDAYLDGTIDDALLVPVTLNYDRLVDGNFVAEQLGRPKQMVTFWSAVRGIWHALIANHGGMRVDFNQPISLKELVTSFQKLNHLALELNSNSLSLNSQMRHSSQYGADVSTKVLVEAIGRHLVYDAAQSTALMSTNVVSYVLLTEHRRGATLKQLQDCVERRGRKILEAGRDLGYTGEPHEVLHHALKILGRSLIAKSGSGEEFQVSPRGNIPALLELCYYANTVAAYYAPQAIVATAIERIIQQPNGDPDIVRHSELMEASLELSVVLSQEFILCAPCRKTEDLLDDSIQSMLSEEIISAATPSEGLEEQQWSRRFAKSLVDDDDDERDDPTRHIKYRVSHTAEAKAERRRLILTLRPLLEAYAATCRCIADGMQKDVVQMTLDVLTEDYQQNRVICGEAVSMDAIRNCQRLLKQWGVIDIYTAGQDSIIQIQSQYKSQDLKDHICNNVYKFNVTTPLLTEP